MLETSFLALYKIIRPAYQSIDSHLKDRPSSLIVLFYFLFKEFLHHSNNNSSIKVISIFKMITRPYDIELLINQIPKGIYENLSQSLTAFSFTNNEKSASSVLNVISPVVFKMILEDLFLKDTSVNIENRKMTGSFYTPSIIVHTMINECLIKYLKNHSNIQANKICNWILKSDPTGLNLHELFSGQALLLKVNIFDPACGSGDFLLPMMHCLYSLIADQSLEPIKKKEGFIQNWLVTNIENSHLDFLSELAIEDQIRVILLLNQYGTDIDPLAVIVTKIRCALFVLAGKNKPANPLPVLKVINEHFQCINPLIKETRNHSKEIDPQSNILNSLNINRGFHPRTLFGLESGFDIILGNPPYLNAKIHSKYELNSLRPYYRKTYSLIRGSFDLYIIFLLIGLEYLKDKGVYSWIIPNKFLVSQYSQSIANYLKQNGLYKIINVSDCSVFHSIHVYPIIIFGSLVQSSLAHYDVRSLEDLAHNQLHKRTSRIKRTFSKTFQDFGIKIASGMTGFTAKSILPYIQEECSKECIPFIVTKNIDRYHIEFDDVRYMKHRFKKAYIIKGKNIAQSKWNLWQNNKIVIAGLCKEVEAVFSDTPLALGVGLYCIYDFGDVIPETLTALLNSRFFTVYLQSHFRDKHLQGGYIALNKYIIQQFPMVDIPKDLQDELRRLHNSISAKLLSGHRINDPVVKEYLSQIDTLVEDLFGGIIPG